MVRWEWNAVKVALELGSNSSRHARQQCFLGTAAHTTDGVSGRYSFFSVREWFTEQELGGKTWACNWCGFRLEFWVERDWGHRLRCWARIQGLNGSGYLGAILQVWAETSNGFFSIRSSYKLTLELETNREIGYCSDGSNIQFWKRLWLIQIPHKTKHFAWRAAYDILPIKENLVCRKVLADSMCEECGSASESFFHLF